MKLAHFFQRFRDNQEIGRTPTDHTLDVYYDNGQDVGRIVQDRPSTRCVAETLLLCFDVHPRIGYAFPMPLAAREGFENIIAGPLIIKETIC